MILIVQLGFKTMSTSDIHGYFSYIGFVLGFVMVV